MKTLNWRFSVCKMVHLRTDESGTLRPRRIGNQRGEFELYLDQSPQSLARLDARVFVEQGWKRRPASASDKPERWIRYAAFRNVPPRKRVYTETAFIVASSHFGNQKFYSSMFNISSQMFDFRFNLYYMLYNFS